MYSASSYVNHLPWLLIRLHLFSPSLPPSLLPSIPLLPPPLLGLGPYRERCLNSIIGMPPIPVGTDRVLRAPAPPPSPPPPPPPSVGAGGRGGRRRGGGPDRFVMAPRDPPRARAETQLQTAPRSSYNDLLGSAWVWVCVVVCEGEENGVRVQLWTYNEHAASSNFLSSLPPSLPYLRAGASSA